MSDLISFIFFVYIVYILICFFTDIWWKFQVNSSFRNIFTDKNGDVFNSYFTCCKSVSNTLE